MSDDEIRAIQEDYEIDLARATRDLRARRARLLQEALEGGLKHEDLMRALSKSREAIRQFLNPQATAAAAEAKRQARAAARSSDGKPPRQS